MPNKPCNCPEEKKAQIEDMVSLYIQNEENQEAKAEILRLFDHCDVCKEYFLDETLFLECIRKLITRSNISEKTAIKIRSLILTSFEEES